MNGIEASTKTIPTAPPARAAAMGGNRSDLIGRPSFLCGKRPSDQYTQSGYVPNRGRYDHNKGFLSSRAGTSIERGTLWPVGELDGLPRLNRDLIDPFPRRGFAPAGMPLPSSWRISVAGQPALSELRTRHSGRTGGAEHGAVGPQDRHEFVAGLNPPLSV